MGGRPGAPAAVALEARSNLQQPQYLTLVGRQGLEPWTVGLKARCSTN